MVSSMSWPRAGLLAVRNTKAPQELQNRSLSTAISRKLKNTDYAMTALLVFIR